MSKKVTSEEIKVRKCNCGHDMIIKEGLDKDHSSSCALKYTVQCIKCGIWYETDSV